ncbi:MAG TPA: MFS transporter [Actinomycetota bacterium]|nr:MFS transporter [Actinomycetota bacterium]
MAAAEKRRLPLGALLAAEGVSVAGNQMALVAIPLFILQTTGSASRTGVTMFFTFLPTVLAGLFGGALVDRLGFRRTSITADLASALAVAAIPLLHRTIGIEFWQVIILVFLGALLDAPGNTARSAILPDLVEEAGLSIDRGTALFNAVDRIATLAGPPVAGILIAVTGVADVLWADALTFVFSAVVVGVAIPRAARRPPAETSYLTDLREGYSFVRGDVTLMSIIALVATMNALDSGLAFVALPVFVERVLDSPPTLGLILGVTGAGAAGGSLAFAAWGDHLPRRWTLVVCFVIVSSFFLGIGAFPPLPVILVHGAIAGAAAGPLNGILGAVLYQRIPEHMRGRALGIVRALSFMAIPLGGLVGGALIGWIGLRATFLLLGGGYVVTALSSAVNRGLRDL